MHEVGGGGGGAVMINVMSGGGGGGGGRTCHWADRPDLPIHFGTAAHSKAK